MNGIPSGIQIYADSNVYNNQTPAATTANIASGISKRYAIRMMLAAHLSKTDVMWSLPNLAGSSPSTNLSETLNGV